MTQNGGGFKILLVVLVVVLVVLLVLNNYMTPSRSFYRLSEPLLWTTRSQTASEYPVDVVFTWVNGSDPNFIALKNTFLNNSLPADSVMTNRWADYDELLESVQSVKVYTPWVRNIYVVTGMSQRPKWYPKNHKDIIFIDHTEIFGDNASELPVFNSHAIEANIWRIPGLSEQFIYFNDDVFLGDSMTKDQFFVNNGSQFILYSNKSIRSGLVEPGSGKLGSWQGAQINTGNIFNDLFGQMTRPLTHHFAKPLLKSVCEESWNHPVLGPYLNSTSKSKFRDYTDVCPIEIFSLYGLETDRAIMGTMYDNLYIGLRNLKTLHLLDYQLEIGIYSMYCINDVAFKNTKELSALYKQILKTKLPHNRIVSKYISKL